jgi:hypothetical protein
MVEIIIELHLDVSLQKVKLAHSTDIYNNRVDNLTTKAHDFF